MWVGTITWLALCGVLGTASAAFGAVPESPDSQEIARQEATGQEASAQEAVRPFTLGRALALADRSRALVRAESQLARQEAAVAASKAQRWPSLDFSQRLTRIDDSTVDRANSAAEGLSRLIGFEIPPFAFQDSFVTRFDLAAPLWTSGGLAAEIAGEQRTLDARRADRDAAWRVTQGAVVRRFFALATASAVAAERQKALARTERRLREARRRLEVGLDTRQEVLRWQVELEVARAGLADTEAAALVARLELADVLDQPFDAVGEPQLPETAVVDALLTWAEGLEPGDVLRRAEGDLDELPEVRSARAEAAASSEAVRGARSQLLPRLDAAATFGWLENETLEPDEFETWSASLSLTVPIDLRGDRRARVAEARALERQAETGIDDVRAAARLEVGRALAGVLRGRSNLRSARRAVEEAAARRELLARQTEVGLTSLLDLVDADTTLVAAEVARATARVDLLAAVAALEIAWPGAAPPAGGLVP